MGTQEGYTQDLKIEDKMIIEFMCLHLLSLSLCSSFNYQLFITITVLLGFIIKEFCTGILFISLYF